MSIPLKVATSVICRSQPVDLSQTPSEPKTNGEPEAESVISIDKYEMNTTLTCNGKVGEVFLNSGFPPLTSLMHGQLSSKLKQLRFFIANLEQ